jgi:hypothetical protein
LEGRHSGLTGGALSEWEEKRRSQNQEEANKPDLKLKHIIYYSCFNLFYGTTFDIITAVDITG